MFDSYRYVTAYQRLFRIDSTVTTTGCNVTRQCQSYFIRVTGSESGSFRLDCTRIKFGEGDGIVNSGCSSILLRTRSLDGEDRGLSGTCVAESVEMNTVCRIRFSKE